MATATAPQTVEQIKPIEKPEEDFTLLDAVIEATTTKLEKISARYQAGIRQASISGEAAAFRRAFLTAQTVREIKKLMTPDVMSLLMELMNTPLGFLTDKPVKKPGDVSYDEETVKLCAIDATLQGVRWTNNEFNIIASKCMVVKNGWRRKVSEVPGLTDLELFPGIPRVIEGRMTVRFGAKWKLRGVEMKLVDHEGKFGMLFPVVARESDSADTQIGKAERKCLHRVFHQATGSEISGAYQELDEVSESPSDIASDPLPADPASRDWIDQEIAALGFPIDEFEGYDLAKQALGGKQVTDFKLLTDDECKTVMAFLRTKIEEKKINANKADAEKAIAGNKSRGGNKQGKFPNADPASSGPYGSGH